MIREHLEVAAALAEERIRNPPVPMSCTNDQARLALIEFGILPEAVDSALAAITDAGRRARLQVMWHYRQTFRRDNEDLQDMAAALGLSGEQIDDLFRLAGSL